VAQPQWDANLFALAATKAGLFSIAARSMKCVERRRSFVSATFALLNHWEATPLGAGSFAHADGPRNHLHVVIGDAEGIKEH
jgi:predicted DNA-binding protein with PD1-like motif